VQTGVMTNLGTGGGTHSSARAINDAGLITGWNYISGTSHAFLWKTGAMTDLGIADGGNDINNTGQVVVSSYYQPGRLWTPTVPNGTTGTFANLGVLPPSQPEFYADCSPQGMNNVGQVVGSSNEYEPWEGQLVAPRAFVWTNGVMEQVPLDVAAAINDAGQIAGTRASRAYLLTPVPPGTPRMTITGGSIVEGDSGVADLAFTVRLSVPGAGPVSVQYATANGAASAGSDYHATTGTLTFAPGEAERDIRIPVIGERVADGFVNEGFWVALSNASGAFVENGSAIGWIIDNEPRIAINDIFVVEGNSGSSTAILQIVLSNEYDQPVSVEYATADTLTPFAAATAGSDYVPVSGTALFYPGDTLFEVHIEVLGDRIAETYRDPFSQGYFNSERITLELTNPSSNVVASGVATIFINDDEPRVSVNPFVSVTEGDPTTPAAVFTVSLSARYDEDVFVNYTTMEVLDPYFTNATPGSDYVATSGVIRFAEGDTEETVEVPILDNSQIEFAEYFNFNISSLGSNVDIEGWNSLGLAEILDNEPPEISIGSVYQNEGNTGTTALTIWVVLSFESSQTVSVNFTTSDGTAIAGNDYQSTSGTLTFAPWETLQPVTVLVNGDRTVEPHETFFVNLSSATNATIADGEGVATIVDDEPRVSISDVTRTEGKKGKPNLFTFTVSLLAAYDQPVTMSFRTVNGTATTSDGDYVAKSGTLTFAAGETSKTITIEVKGDTKREANETFYLDLFGLSGNALFTKNRGIGTIVNDD
jgi:chitinase